MPDPAPQDLSRLRIDRGEETTRRPRTRPGRRRGLGALFLVLIVGGAVWLFWPRIAPVIARLRAPEVRTDVVIVTRPGADLELTTGSGYVIARTRAALATKLIGRLVEIGVEEGSLVTAGQVVAVIEPDTWKHQVDRLEALLAQSRAEEIAAEVRVTIARKASERIVTEQVEAEAAKRETAARLKEAERVFAVEEQLLASGSGTRDAHRKARNDLDATQAAHDRSEARMAMLERDRDSKKAEVRGAQARVTVSQAARTEVTARLASARKDLEDTKIRAPFDGVVLRKEAEVGEMVVPALAGGGTSRGAVVTIASFDSLEFEVDVFERDIRHIREGGAASVIVDAFSDRPLTGRVRRIVPSADRGKGTVLVKVSFDRKGLAVLPEMRGRVTFLSEEPEEEAPPPEILAPANAVVTRDGRTGVFLLQGERVRFQVTDAGERRGNRRVIRSGLQGNETVVLHPPAELRDDMVVRTTNEDG